MSIQKKLIKLIQSILRQLFQISRTLSKKLVSKLLGSLLLLGKSKKFAKAGIVLPAATMVTLVVVVLTLAITARSFDRAKNADNFRVNQVVLNASEPAIYRAQSKIETLFEDPNLPRGTPTEISIQDVLDRDKYTLGDETKLELAFDFGDGTNGSNTFTPDGSIQSLSDGNANSLQNDETVTTAWRFPTDTDNNGLFDSFTLYSIIFRSPNTNSNGSFARERTPLDSRSLPMEDGSLTGICAGAAGTSSSLVGTEGWYQSNGQLKKSFFVHVANVPITDTTLSDLAENFSTSDFETYQGQGGFSALEYQQDQARIPLNNNAIVYEDDLSMFPAGVLRINGRIVTNSNLLPREGSQNIEFYQVSSRNSCFYAQENAKIIVGGNLGYGTPY